LQRLKIERVGKWERRRVEMWALKCKGVEDGADIIAPL